MDEILIDNWNEKVNKRDVVYHLGDFVFRRPILHYRKRLNGKIILIRGGHDRISSSEEDLFAGIYSLLSKKIGKHHFVLCHYAMRVWDRSHFNSFHLYGHSHGRLSPQGKSWDVGVDNNNYFPVSLDEVIDIMKMRPDNINYLKRISNLPDRRSEPSSFN
jgi:calcineurin-like phosphoesterase family protein